MDGGDVTYTLKSVNITETGYYTGGAEINGNTLTLPVQKVDANAEGQIGTITVTISCGNFNDADATIEVYRINKESVTITGATAQNAVYDGKPHNGYTGTPAVVFSALPLKRPASPSRRTTSRPMQAPQSPP